MFLKQTLPIPSHTDLHEHILGLLFPGALLCGHKGPSSPVHPASTQTVVSKMCQMPNKTWVAENGHASDMWGFAFQEKESGEEKMKY